MLSLLFIRTSTTSHTTSVSWSHGDCPLAQKVEGRHPAGNELRAITALPAPHVEIWAFSSFNNKIFTKEDCITPDEWMQRGLGSIYAALGTV